MRITTLVLGSMAVSAMALGWPDDAAAARRAKHRQSDRAYQAERYESYRRPASVAPNGLCQRDTGTHTSQLNFRNRCDTLEFWERMNRGRGAR